MFEKTWPVKLLKFNNVWLKIETRLLCQTFSIQVFIPWHSIHPFFWLWTTTSLLSFSFDIVFLLKIIIGLIFLPTAEQARTILKQVFSLLVVEIGTFSAPTASMLNDPIHVKDHIVLNLELSLSSLDEVLEIFFFYFPVIWECLANSGSRVDRKMVSVHEAITLPLTINKVSNVHLLH